MPRGLAEQVAENPFYVLGLKLECSRQDMEREGQKLLSMLALELTEAKTYKTPLGVRTRTAELVRHSMAELRDPSKRLLHELIASLPAEVELTPVGAGEGELPKWTTAPLAFGYGPARGKR